MKLVVTGAAGLTGGAVTRELVQRGHTVIGVTRSGRSAARISALGVEAVVGDCADPETMHPVLARSDGLVHVAGILLGSRIAMAGIGPSQRLVVVSTAAVYSRQRPEAALYRQNENALLASHPSALIVRPTMIYGSSRDRNVHRVISFAKRWRVLPLPSGGRARVQPVHYEDLAKAIASLVDQDAAGVVDAGGPVPIMLRNAALAIFAALGQRPFVVRLPIGLAVPFAMLVDGVTGSRWSERLERMGEERVVDNTRLLGLTGIRLRSFEEGVSQEVAEMARAR
jgi:uncharacterized protein YbjT (DUF2867 family)